MQPQINRFFTSRIEGVGAFLKERLSSVERHTWGLKNIPKSKLPSTNYYQPNVSNINNMVFTNSNSRANIITLSATSAQQKSSNITSSSSP